MGYSQQEKALIWLCACTQFDYRARAALLRAAKDPAELFASFEKFVPSVIKAGEKRLYNNDRASREAEISRFLDGLEEKGCFALTPLAADYPASLSSIPEPPLALFGKGNRGLLRKRKFCIVGSRITPPWAEEQGRIVSQSVSRHFAVVTGIAEGGDSAAIAGALPSGNVICVLANGLNACYPAAHASLKERIAKEGLLLSEFLPDEQPKRYAFHARNRILAGLSEGVLVISAGVRSGALITASYALDYGRDVFAFPHNLGAAQGAGCNELIKKGAYLASGARDILSEYGLEEETPPQAELTPVEEKILSALRKDGEAHVAVVAARAGVAVYEAAAALSSLEMKNLAVKAGGNRYGALS